MVEMIEMSCTDSHSRAVFSTWNYRASRHSFNLPLTSNKFFSKYICLKLDAKSASLVACVASGRYRRVELSGAQAGVRHLGARRAVHQRDTHTAQAHREAQMWLHGASAGGGSELLTGGAKRERAPGRWRGRLAANDDLNHALMALRAYAAAQAQVGRAT